MYSQGNYGSQYGSPAPPLPASYQQGSSAPALYQQGLPVPPPYQHGPPTPSLTVLPHGPPIPTPPVQQGHPPPVQVTPPGTLNTGRPYFNQPALVHGSSLMPLSYQTSQQTPSYAPPIPSQNVHHTVPPVPFQSGPPLSGPSPPLPRVLPPPPPTAQMLYRTLPPPPLHGNIQGPQPVRPLPPPPSAGFVPVTPAPYTSFMQSSVGDSHPPLMPPPLPPLPPSSPPPLPPSPPPSSSPSPNTAVMASDTSSMVPSEPALNIPPQPESEFCSDNISDSMERTIDPVDKGPIHTHGEDGPCHEMDSPMAEGASPIADALANLPSPPPKPVEEEIARNIEVLCQFIAKLGPDFENLARTKESDNPKFAFLFGGEPGSAAAIGHEYFLWMKRKCELEFKLHNESEYQENSPILRPSEMESSLLSVSSIDRDMSASPDLSDMDMEEDDRPSFARLGTKELSPVRSPLKDAGFTLSCDSEESDKPLMEGSSQAKVSSAVAGGKNEDIPRVFIKNGSPFRLIQDYASDDSAEDDTSASVEDVSPQRVSPSAPVCSSALHEDEGMDVCSNVVSKTVSEIEKISNMASFMTEAVQRSDGSIISYEMALKTVTSPDESTAVAKPDEPNACKDENVALSDRTRSVKTLETVVLQGNSVDTDRPSGKVHKDEDATQASTTLKVDEFGRLVREGMSDSDSDGMDYSWRSGKRGRSPSPQESRWKRRSRSPRRRRDRRSRSRSWSPKKQRSRSKSPPAFRRVGDFGGEKTRRDFKGPPPECFDFLRGKCYRGASCKYLHHDSTPSNPPKWNRNKREHYREVPPDLRNSVVHGDPHYAAEADDADNIVAELGSDGHDTLQEKGKSQDTQIRQDLSVASTKAEKVEVLVEKTETSYVRDDVQLTTSTEIDQSLVAVNAGELRQSQASQEAVAVAPEMQEVQEEEKEHNIHLQEKQDHQQPMETSNPLPAPAAETEHLLVDIPGDQQTGEVLAAEPPSSNISCSISPPELQSEVPHPLHVEGSSMSSSPTKTFPSDPNQTTPLSQLHPNQVPVDSPRPSHIPMSQPYPVQVNASEAFLPESSRPPLLHPKEFHPHNLSAGDFRFQPSQLPPPPYPPLPQGSLDSSSTLQLPDQYQLGPPVSNFQSQRFAVEGFPYQPHIVDYRSQRMPPAKPTWTDLPPPPPPLPSYWNESTHRPANPPMDFHPSQFQQNLMPSRGDIPSQPLMRNHLPEEVTQSRVSGFQHLTFPHAVEESRPKPLEAENRWNQPFREPSFMREERFVSTVIPKSSEFIPKTLQDYHLLPPLQEGGRAFDMETAHSHLPSFLREPTSMHKHSLPGDSLPIQSFSREDFSRTSKNFPYSHQQQSSYDSQLATSGSVPSHLVVPGIVDSSFSRYSSGLSDMGSKVSTSSHYNPFASTFEQTPGSRFLSNIHRLKKFDSVSKRDPTTDVINDTVPTLRPSGSHVPLDVEENNMQKEDVVTIIKPLENDDFDGAATDAEIGAVENGSPHPDEGNNWSPGIPNDLVNTGVGEIEIDQVQTSGKGKKNKDSRLMKLFKIAIADFVKEVLKPSWRQGNMSKEAFKTIVKKTVDKVSGAMQSHQIPKTQTKINQYVESSQRKLTKLVMGYVDKYVKV
ncbi:hypothetical protein AAC387_Pa03g3187 [Persea americana]